MVNYKYIDLLHCFFSTVGKVWAIHLGVHGVQEHGKRGLLSLLAPLLPLLSTRLKTRRKSRQVGRSALQLREAIQQVSTQIVAVLEHFGH